MRIIHFSDIHAGGWVNSLSGYFDKRIVGALNYLVRRKCIHDWRYVKAAVSRIKELKPDIVICTGDLTSIGEPREFEKAISALQPLVDDKSFELLYVPGNHDDYVDNPACKQSLAETFKLMNRDKWTLDELPLSFDFQSVGFLLVNEAVPVPVYLSSGSLDARSRHWLTQNLSAPGSSEKKKRILVGHFPLYDREGKELSWRRRCHNIKILQDAFHSNTIDISLCGHVHREFVRWDDRGSVEICAGSLTWTGNFNLIDYNIAENLIDQQWVRVDAV